MIPEQLVAPTIRYLWAAHVQDRQGLTTADDRLALIGWRLAGVDSDRALSVQDVLKLSAALLCVGEAHEAGDHSEFSAWRETIRQAGLLVERA